MNTIRLRSTAKKFTVINISKNKVDKDVQRILFPFTLMRIVSMTPRYRIKDDIIQPNTIHSYIISFLGTMLFVLAFVFRYIKFLSIVIIGETPFMFFVTHMDIIFYSMAFIVNFLTGLLQTKNLIEFVLIFQGVHRFINSKRVSESYIVWNWVCLSIECTLYFFIYPMMSIYVGMEFIMFAIGCLLIIFDFNEIYAIRVLKLLETKIGLWSREVLKGQDIESSGRDYNRKLFQAYVNILKCYDIHKHGIQYFNFVWQTILNWQCEQFYIAVGNAQDTCSFVLMSQYSDDKKQLCKNVLRLHRASFSKIRVCGLFYLDAALQLSLMSLVTNYTIVLLQFALFQQLEQMQQETDVHVEQLTGAHLAERRAPASHTTDFSLSRIETHTIASTDPHRTDR
ncbi:hypothetical protein SFRURICE_017094 [Spodoptera frugiperda]|nr:hypothetical protein SFRURICE_017094 [Spodoptera frugiperda]